MQWFWTCDFIEPYKYNGFEHWGSPKLYKYNGYEQSIAQIAYKYNAFGNNRPKHLTHTWPWVNRQTSHRPCLYVIHLGQRSKSSISACVNLCHPSTYVIHIGHHYRTSLYVAVIDVTRRSYTHNSSLYVIHTAKPSVRYYCLCHQYIIYHCVTHQYIMDHWRAPQYNCN